MSCSVCGHIHARRGEDGMVNLKDRTCYDCGVCSEKARRQQALEKEAEALIASLTKFVNGMSREATDALATALASEHPTLLGQVAKAVGMGVMRRASYNPEWRPFDGLVAADSVLCNEPTNTLLPKHATHDGRLDCTTVIGADLMARQSLI